MITILAIDLATRTGWARGASDAPTPAFGAVEFAKPGGASANAVFGNCLRWAQKFFAYEREPPLLVIEALLPAAARLGDTSGAVRDRLAGLHGIVRGAAFRAGIYRIEAVSVGDVRAHFIGDRGLKRLAAKRAVVRQCLRLGWNVNDDDDAGDACALWHFGCSLVDPKRALQCSPLFGKGVAL